MDIFFFHNKKISGRRGDSIRMNVNFKVIGTGSVNPKIASISSVKFARYAVQVALQFEVDGGKSPDQ